MVEINWFVAKFYLCLYVTRIFLVSVFSMTIGKSFICLVNRSRVGLPGSTTSVTVMRYLSTDSPNSSKGVSEDKLGKPQMHHLEHIKKRLEYTVPRMFRTHMDYTFYRSDMVYEDRIFQQAKQ